MTTLKSPTTDFIPAFVVCPSADAGAQATVPELHGVVAGPGPTMRTSHPLLPEGESEVARFLGEIQAVALISEGGYAPAVESNETYGLERLFGGLGEFVCSDTRVFGVLFEGQSAAGSFGPSTSQVLAFSLPYAEVETIMLERKKKVLGGLKPLGVGLGSTEPLYHLRLDVHQSRRAGERAQNSDQLAAMEVLVAQACAWHLQRDDLSPELRPQIEAVRDGQRIQDPSGKLVAELFA